MTTNDSLFKSDLDNKYYFWLGAGLHGPFQEYNEAHLAMSEKLKELRGEKETDEYDTPF